VAFKENEKFQVCRMQDKRPIICENNENSLHVDGEEEELRKAMIVQLDDLNNSLEQCKSLQTDLKSSPNKKDSSFPQKSDKNVQSEGKENNLEVIKSKATSLQEITIKLKNLCTKKIEDNGIKKMKEDQGSKEENILHIGILDGEEEELRKAMIVQLDDLNNSLEQCKSLQIDYKTSPNKKSLSFPQEFDKNVHSEGRENNLEVIKSKATSLQEITIKLKNLCTKKIEDNRIKKMKEDQGSKEKNILFNEKSIRKKTDEVINNSPLIMNLVKDFTSDELEKDDEIIPKDNDIEDIVLEEGEIL
jgi:hypothetical protein